MKGTNTNLLRKGLIAGVWCLALFIAIIVAPRVTSVLAAEVLWSDTEFTQVRLISATDTVGESPALLFGLHFRMAPGWKIYWRSPGDAGFPPALNWTRSVNLTSARIAWPAPRRFSILGFETAGYEDEVVLPLQVKINNAGQQATLSGEVNFLTCEKICIPYQVPLSLTLPPGPSMPSRDAHLINRFAERVPRNGNNHGLQLAGTEIITAEDSTSLRIAIQANVKGGPLVSPDVFIEGLPELIFGRPTVDIPNGGHRTVLKVPVDGMESSAVSLFGKLLTLTVVDGLRAAEWQVTAGGGISFEPLPAATTAGLEPQLFLILMFSLLGGLILNLMPCVLPVLSLKLLAVVGHGSRDRRDIRAGFIASSAGIVATFLALAIGLASLKASGSAIGWGIQFQQPLFLVVMVVVLTLFACNLWGYFDINLSPTVAKAAARTRPSRGLGGHFMTGAFATILATPCSAPFLGTAIGFALSRGTGEIMAVFFCLGLGLALPYLAVAAFPRLATWLPQPGRWMVVLRRILGVSLATTAVWLISVLAAQVGATAGGLVALFMAAIIVILAQTFRWPQRRHLSSAAVVVLVSAALFTPFWMPGDKMEYRQPAADTVWQPFDELAIAGLVASGKVILVDITADWCLTCTVNKAVVLERGAIRERLGGDSIVAMQGDWTRPDAAIARYLAQFGRYGIPFNVVYGPRAPQGIPLPEVLTTYTVASSLDAAAALSTAAAR
jgi:suppressor for copper-sensitivity B